jgi:hypothetical protein
MGTSPLEPRAASPCPTCRSRRTVQQVPRAKRLRRPRYPWGRRTARSCSSPRVTNVAALRAFLVRGARQAPAKAASPRRRAGRLLGGRPPPRRILRADQRRRGPVRRHGGGQRRDLTRTPGARRRHSWTGASAGEPGEAGIRPRGDRAGDRAQGSLLVRLGRRNRVAGALRVGGGSALLCAGRQGPGPRAPARPRSPRLLLGRARVFLERRANASDDPERLWTLRRRPTRWCSSVRCFSASTPSSAGTTRPDGAAARGAVVSDACPRPRRRPHDALGTIRGAVGKASCHR